MVAAISFLYQHMYVLMAISELIIIFNFNLCYVRWHLFFNTLTLIVNSPLASAITTIGKLYQIICHVWQVVNTMVYTYYLSQYKSLSWFILFIFLSKNFPSGFHIDTFGEFCYNLGKPDDST